MNVIINFIIINLFCNYFQLNFLLYGFILFIHEKMS
jgi:hypothetical protein